ncbi:gp53-like domain-containing protein [Acinetobacter thermotolerans]|uniref:gp53-like domain-containing protein n=1 Tax=Acinetobacter thermotolerans TaxID=3151487 RepID=UPI00325B2FE5
MAIEKLTEFAKTGQKDTDQLDLEVGFVVNRKPARQWFNWLFNALTNKINEIIDADFMPKSDVVDNLTTNDSAKPLSAKQGKALQDGKLGKTETAVAATKLATARTIALSGGVTGTATSFDGSGNISIPVTAIDGSKITTGTIPAARIPTLNQSTTGNAATATKLQTARTIALSGGVTGTATSFDGSGNISIPVTAIDGSKITTGTIPAARIPTLNQSTTGNAASATNCSRSIVAGNGLSGGGELNANRTLTLGTPSTITASTGNTVSASSHTHDLNLDGFFKAAKSTNGYQQLPGGLILQWGTVDYSNNPGQVSRSVSFPLSFPNACLNVTATRKMNSATNQGQGSVLCVSSTRTSALFSLVHQQGGNIDLGGFTWFAIGY